MTLVGRKIGTGSFTREKLQGQLFAMGKMMAKFVMEEKKDENDSREREKKRGEREIES
jgi:hypothetical protein